MRPGKEFVARRYSFEGATISLDDPWFRAVASRRMLDVANAYLRLWSKLSYVDLWYTAPQAVDEERVASQNWHFDFDDKHLLKAFLYLADVDARGRAVRVRPRQPAGWPVPRCASVDADGVRPRHRRDVLRAVPREDIQTFTAPTRHGHLLQHERSPPGWLRDRPSPGSSRPRRTAHRPRSRRSPDATSRRDVDVSSLDDVVRYALD